MHGPEHVDAKLVFLYDNNFENNTFKSLAHKAPFSPTTSRFHTEPVRIHNARRLQQQYGSIAEFFDRYGFALVSHESSVRDWNTDPQRPKSENDIVQKYWAEIDHLVRKELYPGWGVGDIEQKPYVVRRGPGVVNETGQTATYGLSTHQDFGLDADDYEDNTRALPPPYGGDQVANDWRQRFDSPDVEGMMVINFWRTVHMTEPLRHTPLCVCDPRSVKPEDQVRVGYPGPDGRLTNLMMLRPDAEQMWYYYPDMTNDEVLVFKQFDYFKVDGAARLRTCFHSAFKDPTAAQDAAPRQSCEHRVTIYYNRPRPITAKL